MNEELAIGLGSPVVLGAGSVAGWLLRGGRRRARIDAAAAITAASAAVVQLVESQLPALTARVEAAEARAEEAEKRATQSDAHVALLVRTIQVQQDAITRADAWQRRAAQALRDANIKIDDPPEMPDLVVPVAVSHTTTATTTTATTLP